MIALSIHPVLCLVMFMSMVASPMIAGAEIDLTGAVVVAPADFSGPENKAVRMLIEEVEKRTQVRWRLVNEAPSEGAPTISINRGPKTRPLLREGYQIKT